MLIESQEIVDSQDGSPWVRMCYWDMKNVACPVHGTFNNWDTMRTVEKNLPGRCPICLKKTVALMKTVIFPEGCLYIDTEVEREEVEIPMASG